jgi:hypothetical protein
VGVGCEPDRDTRSDDQQALEEIRRLCARYREAARHGVVIEYDEPAELRDEESEETQTLAGR